MKNSYFWQANPILGAEEGWGEIEISTKRVVDRRGEGEGEGRGREKKKYSPYPINPLPAHFYRNLT